MSAALTTAYCGRMCRACMYKEGAGLTGRKRSARRAEQQEQLISIFGYSTDNEKVQIVELLTSSIPQLLIQTSDELPKLICSSCLHKLLDVHNFQQMCVRSEQHMRNLLEYNAVEAKFTQVEEAPTNAETVKLTDDPLQNSSCSVIGGDSIVADVNVSMEDVQSFLKLEIEEPDVKMAMLNVATIPTELTGLKAEVLDESDECAIEEGTLTSVDDADDNESDWAEQQRKQKITKAAKSTEMAQVKSEVGTEEDESESESEKTIGKRKRSKTLYPKKYKIETASTKSGNYKCDQCPRKYLKQSTLIKHKEMHNLGLVKEYACDQCDKKFMKSYHLNRHKRSHENTKDCSGSRKREIPRPYVCEYCNKAFQQSCTLKDHVRVHTGEQPYLCSECGKAFNSASNMKQHLLRHTGLKRYECPDCPKKFPCLSDLASHKAVHRKHKPHICDICGAAFGKPFQLKKHKMYHNGEKPHKCEYCEMRFVCADHMRRHQRTHTGEKPYKCKYCDRAFAQSNDLVKHLRSHLGDNVYKCELCPKAFRLASELREHFAQHKNDDEETRQLNLKALVEEEARLRINLLGSASIAQECLELGLG